MHRSTLSETKRIRDKSWSYLDSGWSGSPKAEVRDAVAKLQTDFADLEAMREANPCAFLTHIVDQYWPYSRSHPIKIKVERFYESNEYKKRVLEYIG